MLRQIAAVPIIPVSHVSFRPVIRCSRMAVFRPCKVSALFKRRGSASSAARRAFHPPELVGATGIPCTAREAVIQPPAFGGMMSRVWPRKVWILFAEHVFVRRPIDRLQLLASLSSLHRLVETNSTRTEPWLSPLHISVASGGASRGGCRGSRRRLRGCAGSVPARPGGAVARPARGSDRRASCHRLRREDGRSVAASSSASRRGEIRRPTIAVDASTRQRRPAGGARGRGSGRGRRSPRARSRCEARGHCPSRDARRRASISAGASRVSASPGRRACRRKCSARAGMSSRRSRSGGRWIGKTLRRKNRSSRNRPVGHELAERPVRRGEDPDVGRPRPGVADRREGAVLDDPQELDLEVGRDVAQLVEQQGPAGGELEQARPVLVRPGERTLQVAEELALDQGRAERGEADRHERAGPSRAVAMDRPGDQLLAGAALAGDQHRHVRRGHQRDLLEQRPAWPASGRRAPRARMRRLAIPVPAAAPRLSSARVTTPVAWSRSNGLTR